MLFFTLQQERENFNCYISLLANCQRACRLNVDIIIFERLNQNGTEITFVLFGRFNLDLNENNLHNKCNWVFGVLGPATLYSELKTDDIFGAHGERSNKLFENWSKLPLTDVPRSQFFSNYIFPRKSATDDRKTTNYDCPASRRSEEFFGIDLKVFEMNPIQSIPSIIFTIIMTPMISNHKNKYSTNR